MNNTPKTPKNATSTRSKAALSPVTVANSPVNKSTPKNNLTGLPRRVQDLIANFHSFLEKWESNHLDGIEVIAKMKSLNIFDGSKRKYTLDDKLQVLCDLLAEILRKMVQDVEMMNKLSKELDAITSLSEVKQYNYDSPETPLFLTWPISKFVDVVDYILKSYQQELMVRQMVLEQIGLSQDPDEFEFCVSAWTLQPMLYPDEITFKIEAALFETGLVFR